MPLFSSLNHCECFNRQFKNHGITLARVCRYLYLMKTAFLAVALLSSSLVWAQEEKPKGFDKSSTDVVTGTDIRLLPASRVLIDPVVPQSENPKINLSFSTPEFVWNTTKFIQNVEPEKIKEKSSDSVYLANYLRLGGGNNAHIIGELFLANRPSNQWAYNFSAKHFQANQLTLDQKLANTRVDMSGSRFFQNSSITTGLFYKRDFNTFFSRDTLTNEAVSSIGDIARGGKVAQNFGMNIDYQLLESRKFPEIKWSNSIQMFNTNLKHEEFEAQSKLTFLSKAKKFSLFGDAEVNYLQFKQPTQLDKAVSDNQLFIYFRPRVQFYHKPTQLDVKLGFDLSLNQNSFWDTALTPRINPYVAVEKGITGLEMKIYGGIDGGLKKHSIREIHNQMPFFTDSLPIRNSFEQLNGFIGLKGKISSSSMFYMNFGGNAVADMLMFASAHDTKQLGSDSLNPMRPIYSDVNSVYFRTGAEYVLGETFKIGGHLKFNNYTTTAIQVWHLPAFTYNVEANWTPIKELKIKAGINGVGKRYNRVLENNNLKVKDIAGYSDVFARVDYRFIGKGRIWLQGTNLLNRKYPIWYGYPAYGLTITGGISIGLF